MPECKTEEITQWLLTKAEIEEALKHCSLHGGPFRDQLLNMAQLRKVVERYEALNAIFVRMVGYDIEPLDEEWQQLRKEAGLEE